MPVPELLAPAAAQEPWTLQKLYGLRMLYICMIVWNSVYIGGQMSVLEEGRWEPYLNYIEKTYFR